MDEVSHYLHTTLPTLPTFSSSMAFMESSFDMVDEDPGYPRRLGCDHQTGSGVSVYHDPRLEDLVASKSLKSRLIIYHPGSLGESIVIFLVVSCGMTS